MNSASRFRSRFTLRWRVLTAGAALVLLPVSAIASTPCPSSTLTFPGPVVSEVVQPTYDVTNADGSWIRGDHAAGTFSTYNPGSLSPTDLVARDRFDVSGVPTGTVVSLTAVFVVNGTVTTSGCGGSGCCGTCVVTIRAGADTLQAHTGASTMSGSAGFSAYVLVPFTVVAGTPRDLEVEIWSRRCPGGAHSVTSNGALSFWGVTGAMHVTSCKGYDYGVVPTRQHSWGRLKAIYR